MFRSIAILTLCLVAFTAKATIVQIDYEGIVYQVAGTGFGYSLGAPVMGQMLIDTDAVEWTEYCQPPANCDYFGSDLVLGDVVVGTGVDWVYVNDRVFETCYQCSYFTELFYVVTSAEEIQGEFRISSSQNVWLFDAERDYLTGNGLEQNFTLLRDGISYYARMTGHVEESKARIDTGELIYMNSVDYHLNSITVTTVPLPPAVWLFGSALGVMGWLRRRVST